MKYFNTYIFKEIYLKTGKVNVVKYLKKTFDYLSFNEHGSIQWLQAAGKKKLFSNVCGKRTRFQITLIRVKVRSKIKDLKKFT